MSLNNKKGELISLLNNELQKENSDYDKILSLSQEIVSFDTSKIRFSIDAGVIDRLGKELVARQETAVSELVKNSYDADATEVKLTFIDSDSTGGTLLIDDNGDGMTREELVNGFMRISSTEKVHNPYSNRFKRKRAGKKGIGRFAVQRLGKKLTIITQTNEFSNALKLTINWEKYQQDLNLLSISNSLESIPKIKPKGTELIIEDLRDKWSISSIKRIYRYVSDIIQPYALSEEKTQKERLRKEENSDIGFSTTFYKKSISEEPIIIADDSTEIFTHAIAKIEGWIDEKGQGVYTIFSESLGLDEIGEIGNDPDNKFTPFDKLKKIKFRAYYFLLDQLPKQHISHIRNFLKTQGSIRLYRNGFRVLPYGEPGDDWLKLDLSLRTRSILPSHGNNNFFGLVEMTDDEDEFIETSSREGLVDGDELKQLQNFIYRTLVTGVIKVAEVRNIKITTSQEKNEEGQWDKIELRIQNIVKTIDELDQELEGENISADRKKKRKKKVKKIKKELRELEELQKAEHTRYINESSMLRVLGSVGLSIAQFIHEIKYYLDNIDSDINFLINKLQTDSKILTTALTLSSNFSSFRTYTSYFDDVISKNVIRELRPLDMEVVISDFVKSTSTEAKRSGIQILDPIIPVYRVFTLPMHPSEWASIFFNFYTNSKKAIRRAKSQGKIQIEAGEVGDSIYVEFSDNGDGIPKEMEEKIFYEFFTTTAVSDFESLNANTEILGTGLGLKIVKDIVKGYNGSILIVSPKEDFTTTIRIEVPKATEKEYETYNL